MQMKLYEFKRVKAPKRISLDNAANFFPGATSSKTPWVFRLSCELNEDIDPWILQYSTEDTLKQFPLYQSVIHKGLFWYKLEESKKKPIVKEERFSPCRSIYDKKHQNLQFSVSYLNQKIHLEVYHVLSDGEGALAFFKLLVATYLTRKHSECHQALSIMKEDISSTQAEDDAFKTYYSNLSIHDALKDYLSAVNERSWTTQGYRLTGSKEPNNQLKTMVALVDCNQVLTQAHRLQVSVTALLSALLMQSIYATIKDRHNIKPIVVTIPVNLRKYFPSKSTRNFFQAINVGHHFANHDETLQTISRHIKEQLDKELTPEMLTTRMNALCSLEHNALLTLVPRPLKDVAFKLAKLYAQPQTTSVSNLGRIEMPSVMKPYIQWFDFTASTPHLQLNVCTYENKMMLNFSSRFIQNDVQGHFFQLLSDLGIESQKSLQ